MAVKFQSLVLKSMMVMKIEKQRECAALTHYHNTQTPTGRRARTQVDVDPHTRRPTRAQT